MTARMLTPRSYQSVLWGWMCRPLAGRSRTRSPVDEDGRAVWEEEDYCSPPLDQERTAVLDEYFDDIEVERVEPGEGRRRMRGCRA